MIMIGIIAVVVAALLLPRLGTEFLPKLEEGNFWIRVSMPTTLSLQDGEAATHKMRMILLRHPEITTVTSQHGRPDNGTDASPFSNVELYAKLKPESGYPDVATIVLSMHDESLYAERAFRAGARGYIMKRDVTGRILEAIRCVLTGKRYLSERLAALLAEKLVGGSSGGAGSPIELLSGRELEVFQLLGRGHTTRQIAEELHVTFGTVQAFCARIKEKLKLKNATELLREAIQWDEKRNSDENEFRV